MSRNNESLLDELLNERASLQTLTDRLAEELGRSKAREAALQALLNERDEKLAKYAEFLTWCESAPVGSGVCCCGDNMESHGHYADHGAVDEWDHSLGNWAKELRG